MTSADNPNTVAIFIQDACYLHRYIRSTDLSAIVERPERLRAVKVGLAAAIARLEEISGPSKISKSEGSSGEDDLADAIAQLNLGQSPPATPITVVHSAASVDILNNPAVKFVHGDIDRDVYLEKLKSWAAESSKKIEVGESEIPQGLPQGDLYLCPESISAMQGALGTVCEAVNRVIDTQDPIKRAFVAIRPPGHHCGEDTPAGFCFLNNVCVAAVHAYLKHSIKRVLIFDIDLHHGNGTQAISWQINEETYRKTLEQEAGAPLAPTGPQIFYGSIHDVLSYPCEDGKLELIQAASTNIRGAHGQYIENIHLQTYTSESYFFDTLYKEQYSQIFQRAANFVNETGGPGEDVLVFISCGMDACEHEYESMSRHKRNVPTSFYYRFTKDACDFSSRYANGRLVSVLEGGYSDRALSSGAMAHLVGLSDVEKSVDESWWDLDNLTKLEQATKRRRGKITVPKPGSVEPWIERAVALYLSLDANGVTVSSSSKTPIPPSYRILRDRKKTELSSSMSVPTSPESKEDSSSLFKESSSALDGHSVSRKLPRVILKLGPRPDAQ